MEYSPPHSEEAKKVSLLYFLILLIMFLVIGVFGNNSVMTPDAEAIKRAASEQRFDIANSILDIYDEYTSPDDVDYKWLKNNFDIESHVHSVLMAYSLDAGKQYEAYRLLYRVTKKEQYKEQMDHLKLIAEAVQ